MCQKVRFLISGFSPEAPLPVHKPTQCTQERATQFSLGENKVVTIPENRGWHHKAQVERSVAHCSYPASTEGRNALRRNQMHLRPSHEEYSQQNNYSEAHNITHTLLSSGPARGHEGTNVQVPSSRSVTRGSHVNTGQSSTYVNMPLRKSTRAREPSQWLCRRQ